MSKALVGLTEAFSDLSKVLEDLTLESSTRVFERLEASKGLFVKTLKGHMKAINDSSETE